MGMGQAGIEWIHLFLTCLLVHLTFMASLYKSCFTEASPSFGISKKTGDIQIVTDFRELNKWVEVDPFPLPRINETHCRSLRSSSLISLDEESQKLCATILPWGK